MTTLTTIEKAAKLMGLEYEVIADDVFIPETIPDLPDWRLFNPYTSKSDLMDVECELGIDVVWDDIKMLVVAEYWRHGILEFDCLKRFANYDWNKLTARAHAVMDVVEQIYDAKFGKDGE